MSTDPSVPADTQQMHVLEPDTLLSRSMVWGLQRTFYTDQGVAAWSQSRVPQSVTTSPNIAGAYARIALGFLHDVRTHLDPSHRCTSSSWVPAPAASAIAS